MGAWLLHRYPPGLATSVCCRKPLFWGALTSWGISVWLALGNPHPVSATDPGGLRGEAAVRHLGKQVAGRGAGQGRGSGDHSRSGNLLHGFLIISCSPPPALHTLFPPNAFLSFLCQFYSFLRFCCFCWLHSLQLDQTVAPPPAAMFLPPPSQPQKGLSTGCLAACWPGRVFLFMWKMNAGSGCLACSVSGPGPELSPR